VKTAVSSKGQIILPAELRLSAPPDEGVIDWLLSCPQKGFFVPVESDSTDTLKDPVDAG